MRMLCDNTKSFHPLSHYGSARKARIDRIIFEKFHAPAINAASSELLEEKTNKSDAEFQEWDVTRSYVYILDRMSSFVNASNQHQDATPTYLETRANPAELRQRVSKVKKRKRARRGVRKPRRQSDKQKFPIRTERGVVSQPAVGTRFATTVAGGNSFSEPLSKSIAQGGGQYKTTFHNQFRSPLPDHKSCGEKYPGGQRQTHKFFNIAQAKQLLRKDSKAYLAYVEGTKREAPIENCEIYTDHKSQTQDVDNAGGTSERTRGDGDRGEVTGKGTDGLIEIKLEPELLEKMGHYQEEKMNEERESLTEKKSNVRKMRREL
ncbi:hypothetical protein AgCh_001797 [Apium graveolens]